MTTLIAETPVHMTAEDVLALPEDGVERELIRGELREKPMTRRNPSHSRLEAVLCHLLMEWSFRQPRPRGQVVGGEAGFRLRRQPDTLVGIDVAYVSPELAANITRKSRIYDGIPVLAVEILSPSDTHEEISDKVLEYLAAGVPLVWVVNPIFCTITIYRPDAEPELFNRTHELSAEPHLPDFRVSVRQVFDE